MLPFKGSMARPSKETDLRFLFYNYPAKPWRFSELVREAGIAESKVAKWLKRFKDEGLILRVERNGAKPHYLANEQSPAYRQKKRIAGLQLLEESGLLAHLASLDATVILFGSFSRSDWHARSDVDLFLYGAKAPNLSRYEERLGREIQIFPAHDRKSLEKFGARLMKNILEGILITGGMGDELFATAGRGA